MIPTYTHTLLVLPGDDLPDIEIEHEVCAPSTVWDGMVLAYPSCRIEGLVDHYGLEAYVPWTLLPHGRYGLKYWILDPGTELATEGIDLVPADQDTLRALVALANDAGHPPGVAGTDADGDLFIEWDFDTSRRTW